MENLLKNAGAAEEKTAGARTASATASAMAAGARGTAFTGASIVLSPAEAEEYCVFKRKKRVDEVLAALKKTVILPPEDLSATEISKCAEAARGVKALALRVPSNKVAAARNASAGGVAVDAIVGGNGETSWQVKRYEAKRALRDGAGRITLILSPSAVQTGKTGETKREIKKVCKAVKKRPVTVALPENVAARTDKAAWKKIAGLAADYGAKYLSVPFFAGAEELRTFLKDTCMLEITGVQTAADFKTMIAAGAESIAMSAVACGKIRAELLAEAENCSFAVPAADGSFFAEAAREALERKKTGKESETQSADAEKLSDKSQGKIELKTPENV